MQHSSKPFSRFLAIPLLAGIAVLGVVGSPPAPPDPVDPELREIIERALERAAWAAEEAEEALGTWLALGITVALFGLAHLGNPNATLYGAAAIGIEAGMLLGAAYVVTRRLWLAVGVHFGWNFMQAGVFGPNLSGRQVGSLLESRLSGPDLLSGGALGVEGSVFAIAVCLAASLVFLKRARREGGFIRPFWRATIEAPS